MGAQVISLFQRSSPIRDWSQQELAEFYRVENALLQAGMQIETDRGVTDDGEPWFAFCRADDGEVFIHFARIGGQYIIAGSAYGGVIKGWDFASLVRELIDRHPLVQMGPARKPTNIFMHPAALLIAVVGTAFFKTGEAKADDGESRSESGRRLTVSASSAIVTSPSTQVAVEAHQTMTLVAAAMAAATYEAIAGQSASQMAWRLADDQLSYAASTGAFINGSPDSGLPIREGSSGAALGGAVQDLSDWLALTAVLSDVAAPVMSHESDVLIVGRQGVAGSVSSAPVFDPSLPPAGAPTEAVSPTAFMIVELTAGPLPDVAGVRLVQAMGILETAQIIRVVELPQFLADFIANGQQIVVSSTDGVTPIEVEPEAPVSAPIGNSGALDFESVTEPVLILLDSPIGPATVPLDTVQTMTDAEVTQMIGRFVSSTPFQIISAGDDLVFYDSRVRDLSSHSDTYTLVMTFADGGTVTLIGMAHSDYDFLLPGGG